MSIEPPLKASGNDGIGTTTRQAAEINREIQKNNSELSELRVSAAKSLAALLPRR